ncbi:10432_t:CDS:2 [Funneliformis geosporum]|nr:10432_t:CDS:2 [Funneliformis geosporum]
MLKYNSEPKNITMVEAASIRPYFILPLSCIIFVGGDEVQSVLGKNPLPITIEDCVKFSERFPYIDAVVKEVAWLSSLAPLVDRNNAEPEEFVWNVIMTKGIERTPKIFIRILWESPIWKTPQSYKSFLNTLKKEKTLYNYSQMIRHLSFAPYKSRPQPSFSFSDLHLLTQKCFNITHLTFGHDEGTIIAPESVLLLIKKNPNITSIKFLTLHFDDKWMSTALMPIINGHCSKLREILFCEPSPSSQQITRQQTIIPTTKELNFNFLYSIGRKCKSVDSLEIRTKVSNTNSLMIIKFFSHLTSLSIKTIEPEALKTLLHGFPNLKSFSFTFPQSISKEMTTEFAKEFPPLESLSAVLDLDTSSTFINTFATTQTKLKNLDLFNCSNLIDSDLILLSEFCNQLESINLSFCQNLTDETISSLTQKNRQLKKIQLTNMPNLSNNGILLIVKNCPNLTSFIFNVNNINQSRITSLAFIHLLQNCKKLKEFSGHFPKSTATKILFELSKKRYFRGKGGCYKNLEILKIFPIGHSCVFKHSCVLKSNLELKSNQNSEIELLENLADNCQKLRILVLKCSFSKLNRNAVLKYKNLEELSIKLKQSQSLSANHLKRLSSHPKLREFELGDAVTVDAKNIYEKMTNPQQVTKKNVDENTDCNAKIDATIQSDHLRQSEENMLENDFMHIPKVIPKVETIHDYYGIQYTYKSVNAETSSSEKVRNKLNEAKILHESLKFNQAKEIYQDLADNYNNPHAQYQLGMYFYCGDYGVHEIKHDNRLIHKPMNDHMMDIDFSKYTGVNDNGSIKESPTMDENDFLDENEAKQIAIDYFLRSAEQGYHNAFNILAITSDDRIRRHYSAGENVSYLLHLQNDDVINDIIRYMKAAAEWKFPIENCVVYINMYAKLNYGSLLIKASKNETDSYKRRELRSQGLRHLFEASNVGLKDENYNVIKEIMTDLWLLPNHDEEDQGISNDEYLLDDYLDESEIEPNEDFDNPSDFTNKKMCC